MFETTLVVEREAKPVPVATSVGFDSSCSNGWDDMPPSPELAVFLEACPPAAVDDFELIEVIKAARRLEGWVQSLLLMGLAELSHRRHSPDGPARQGYGTCGIDTIVVEEVAAALTLTSASAARLVHLAESLADRLPETRRALTCGQIDLARLEVLMQALQGIDPRLAHQVERRVLPELPHLTTAQLRRRIRRLLATLDPDAAQERKKKAIKERRLEHWDNPSGTADLVGRDLSDMDVQAIVNRLTAVARAMKADGDERGIDALRADLYIALLRGTPLPEAARHLLHNDAPDYHEEHGGPADDPTGERAPRPTGDPFPGQPGEPAAERVGGRRATAQEITAEARAMASATADELRRELTRLISDARTADGTGPDAPIVVQAVREITEALAGLRLRWCLEHFSPAARHRDQRPRPGEPQHGTDCYRPSPRMRDHVRHRDGSCRFPTCGQPAVACDIDHTEAHHRGGPTCPCNLAELCRRHHTLKQTPGWGLHQPWPGVLLWTTPSGQWYLVGPDP